MQITDDYGRMVIYNRNRYEFMRIEEVHVNAEKQKITRMILEDLPEWFGIPESREAYIQNCTDKLFFAAFDNELPVGFVYLDETGRDTAELHVIGVRKAYHRQGIGRALFDAAMRTASEKGYSFLQVKTVKMGCYKEYDDTNRFYQSLGFKEFEMIPDLWSANNPCQIYVMYIGNVQ